MSLTGSLSDLQISIPFFVPSVSEQGPGLGSGRPQGVCEARAAAAARWGAGRGPWGAGMAAPHVPRARCHPPVPTPIPLH